MLPVFPERIKIFEQKNKNVQNRNLKNNIETSNKKLINTEVHKNKFVDDSENSNNYVKQSIKRKSILKMNNNANNVSVFQIFKSKINNNEKNSNKSVEKDNIIYDNFVQNLKINFTSLAIWAIFNILQIMPELILSFFTI